MTWRPGAFIVWLTLAAAGCHGSGAEAPQARPGPDGVWHVRPGESIQSALDAAAADPEHKTVRVHEGGYRPAQPGQAMVWFNRRHDGIRLEAEGNVTLTAANPEIADRSARSFPAVVNHVVFFGDGITSRTVFRGFRITGANNFVTPSEDDPIEPDSPIPRLRKGEFFYTDGGAIKIFGRSYPKIQEVEVFENYASPCGGGVSVEHRGFVEKAVEFRSCVFRDNRCQVTGSAVDLLPGSSAVFENCLFHGNVSNTGVDFVGQRDGTEYNPEHGSGALTVFPGSRVIVKRCTFTGNWNGVDDKGTGNTYERSIFWRNTVTGGISPGGRYEMDVLDGRGVRSCCLAGDIVDLRGSLDAQRNVLNAPDPLFDAEFVPQSSEYDGIGYRPIERSYR